MHKQVIKKQLDNGLTLLLQPMPMLESVSVGLQVSAGSREEQNTQVGLSHLIEHMLFQGTAKRSMRELSRIITAVGGQLDACTGRESMVIYSKVPADHMELAIDVIADMIFNPTVRPKALAKEKAVIIEEINMVDDTPDELIHDLFYQALWPRQALGRTILGTKKQVQSLSRKQLKDYMADYYRPSNMILAIAGKFSANTVMDKVRKYFKTRGHCDHEAVKDVVTDEKVMNIWRKRPLEQVHLCMGVRTFPYHDPRRLATVALSNILGGGTNSRLFYEVRERYGLSYAVYSFVDFYRDAGLLGIYAGCHPKKLEATVAVIKKQLTELVNKGVTKEELKDVKEQLKGNLKLSLESSSSHMWSMLQHESYVKKHPATESIIRSIEQLTHDDMASVIDGLIASQPIASAVLGPYKKRIPF